MSDRIRTTPDVAWRAAGIGMSANRLCMGCNTAKSQTGSAGQGVRWRCAACLAQREQQRKAGAAA
jgi:hypothetical protein